jgi:threonine dehydratase
LEHDKKAAMTREDYDAFCGRLPHATHVVQWGDASVWKIGGKVFAVGGWSGGPEFAVTFKCSDASFTILKELPGLRPAPYLASRGLSWIQRLDARSLSDHDLNEYVRRSYAMVLATLPRKTQDALEAPASRATITPSDIRSAHARIRARIRRTPVIETSSPLAGAPPLSLKLECLQVTGSFKARGAFHNLLTRPAAAAGCATASGGNHGAAVAYAAQKLGVRARVFVPERAPPAKIAKIKAYDAEAVIGGASYAEAQQRCDAYVAETGALLIHPYDAVETIAGQGTVALEWEEDLKRLRLEKLDTVLVAVGGGGLISGVAAWFQDRVKVVGVEPEGSCALHAALKANAPVDVSVKSVAADSLGAKRVGDLNFDIAKSFVGGVVLVADAAIAEAQGRLWTDHSIIAEPGGAAAFAAIMSGAYRPERNQRVGVLVCGANADLAAFAETITADA